MKFENYGVVYCCDRDDDCVRYDYDRNVFYIDLEAGPGVPYVDNVEYCPWCGILLDTNLLGE